MQIGITTDLRGRHPRGGAAAVELALLLPLLVSLLLMTIDFARLYYHYTTITTCARNGALYASDTFTAADSEYSNYQQAAMADGVSLNPPLTVWDVSSTSGTDDGIGPWVAVTVTYNFRLVSSYLGFSNRVLSRTVRMRKITKATPG